MAIPTSLNTVSDRLPVLAETAIEEKTTLPGPIAKADSISKETLDKLQQLEKLYKPLTKHIFESWQEVAKLPKVDEPLTYDKNFLENNFNTLEKSVMRCEITPQFVNKPLQCILFKTIIRNADGTFKKYNIEILRFSSLYNNWEYQTKECWVSSTFPVISYHIKNLLKHEPVGEIEKEWISLEEQFEWIEENEEIRHVESTPKITKDRKPIVELTEDKMICS